METVYNAGLVGFGLAGSAFHAPVLTSSGRFQLRAVVTSRAAEVAQAYPDAAVCPDYQSLLEMPDIDVVVVASPNTTHFEIAQAALESGKHVIIDKPWVISADDGEQLQHIAAEQGKKLSVYHNRRYDNDFLTLQQLIADGVLGEIREFHSHFDRYRPHVRDRWREQNLPGSGILYDLGPHLIDQALVLFGPPLSVFADVAATRAGSEIEDYFHILLEYPQTRVILHSGCFVARFQTDRFRVYGTRGSWRIDGLDPQEDALRSGRRPAGPEGDTGWGIDAADRRGELCRVDEAGNLQPVELTENQPGDYTRFYRAFAEAIDGTAPLPVDLSDALCGIRIIEAALQSSRDGRRIFL
ncbi:oxidoreductase [Spirochaeta africana]|uniref:Putative dehydrogenase n=1 Tax=Spirochaeta africana (strain ATCC 700263 / DSM 8902 / Z-7692) TaxID=889378 RepID=H9UL01_SPIAZ|nr:oxidoreductase [Spirochaeta africana]AFG38194.1 putative dehydrogenase [Spirochaeta africana DSM 8902]